VHSAGSYETFDINRIIEQISKQENLSEKVVLEAIKRIGYAQEQLGDEDMSEVN